MSLPSLILKTAFAKSDRKRDKGLTTPENIMCRANIKYGKSPKWNLLDIYYPKGTHAKLPTIVNVHGGGWVYGTKETYRFYCMELASYGFTVVNFSYRLAPRAKFPSQLEDINLVLEWMYENRDEYFFDYDNIFLVGDSAGAHLASLYISFLTDETYRSNFDFAAPEHLGVKALVMNCGITSIKSFLEIEEFDTASLVKDLTGKKDFEGILHLIDPVALVNKNFPPVYLMSSSGDFLLKSLEPMRKKLDSLGVEYEEKICGDEDKKLFHVFHLDIRNDDAKALNNDEIRFLRKHVNKK